LKGEECSEESTDETNQTFEDGNGGSDNVGEEDANEDTAEPGDPVSGGVGGKVTRTTKESNEELGKGERGQKLRF